MDHDSGPLHPETRRRLDAISNQLIMSGLDFVIRHYDAPEANRAQLSLAHDPAYVDRVERSLALRDGEVVFDGVATVEEVLPLVGG